MTLPEELRIPIHLYYYEDLSIAQIAQIMGKSKGAVKTRLSRARGQAAGAVDERGRSACLRMIIAVTWTLWP